ncbi:universal stress protein [Haloglomus litoreum]|uniref:universal stress protein n=1 Tax=Haloglomus litoreum TaxID=3034026 RepID=UPI0023E81E1B|nr:universal stress protein [Haloglomus sp. DT116]
MYEHILVATDGSDRTRGAVAHALGVAERYGATVHALYVVDSRALTIDEDGFGDYDQLVTALEERGERATESIAQQAEARGLATRTAVAHGTPARGIRQYADDHEIDLIAMGTQGRTGLARYVLGSVSESVLRKADQPVLTVNRAATTVDPSYDRILLPTDGSGHAGRVADHAFDIAARYDATVHALSVIDENLIRSPDLLATLERESDAALTAARERGEAAGVDVVARVWRGAPYDCITTYASERDIDLVTMGAHGKRGLHRFLTQNTAERVVRRAPCPVWTLRR